MSRRRRHRTRTLTDFDMGCAGGNCGGGAPGFGYWMVRSRRPRERRREPGLLAVVTVADLQHGRVRRRPQDEVVRALVRAALEVDPRLEEERGVLGELDARGADGAGKILSTLGGPGTLSFELIPWTPAELVPVSGSTAVMTATPDASPLPRTRSPTFVEQDDVRPAGGPRRGAGDVALGAVRLAAGRPSAWPTCRSRAASWPARRAPSARPTRRRCARRRRSSVDVVGRLGLDERHRGRAGGHAARRAGRRLDRDRRGVAAASTARPRRWRRARRAPRRSRTQPSAAIHRPARLAVAGAAARPIKPPTTSTVAAPCAALVPIPLAGSRAPMRALPMPRRTGAARRRRSRSPDRCCSTRRTG